MYARIISDVAVDVATDPATAFHPDLAVEFVAVPDDVRPGWRLVDGAWQAPEPVAEPEPVPVDLAGLKAALTAQIDAERDRRTDAGFEFAGVRYQSRPSDRENISGAALAALGAIVNGAQAGDYRWHGGAADFAWIAEDNSLHPMDAQTTYAFGQAAMAHKQSLIFEARALKDAVAAAEDEAGARAAAIWPD